MSPASVVGTDDDSIENSASSFVVAASLAFVVVVVVVVAADADADTSSFAVAASSSAFVVVEEKMALVPERIVLSLYFYPYLSDLVFHYSTSTKKRKMGSSSI